jgi:hypothetical protein
MMKGNASMRLGIWLTVLCIIHCTILPLLIVLFPMLLPFESAHEWLHAAFALLLIPATTFAAMRGYRMHRKPIVPILFAVGLALFSIGAFCGVSDTMETPTIVAAGMLILFGYWRNRCECACGCNVLTKGEHHGDERNVPHVRGGT